MRSMLTAFSDLLEGYTFCSAASTRLAEGIVPNVCPLCFVYAAL